MAKAVPRPVRTKPWLAPVIVVVVVPVAIAMVIVVAGVPVEVESLLRPPEVARAPVVAREFTHLGSGDGCRSYIG
jgi:hypothetical protein